MSDHLIELKNTGISYGKKHVLSDINLTVAPAEIVTIIGPNGAGKSTLVKLLAGLEKPTVGKLHRKHRLRIGYMPQKLRIDRSLPIKVSRFLSLAERDRKTRHAVLEQLRITHLASQQLQALSGGELQRVLLARSILLKPELLILDEPLQGVDISGQVALYSLIASLRDSLSCAIVMVSHDLHLVMAQTDTVICLNGHVCCHGKPENVSQHPEYLKLFGRQAENLAVYTHHHDHQHDMHGAIVTTDSRHQGCKHD